MLKCIRNVIGDISLLYIVAMALILLQSVEDQHTAVKRVEDDVIKGLRNPGRNISFPIFTRKEIETERIRKEIKTIISRLNRFLSFLSNI